MRRQTRAVLAAVLALALMLGVLWNFRSHPATADPDLPIPAAGVVLTANHADSAGIDPATSFQLASAQPLTLKQVERGLTVTPAVALKYEQKDAAGQRFTIKPVQPLDPNKIYRFRMASARPYQWSFQTKAEFRVLGTLPRNQSTGVPVDTGIEITFSHENYGDVAPLFSIAPKVKGRFERHKKTVAFVPADPLQPGTVYTVTLQPGLTLAGSDLRLDQEFRFAFETAPADAAKQGAQTYFSLGRNVAQFAVGDTPYFPVQYYGPNGSRDLSFKAEVFRYEDSARFIDALKQADQVPWWADYSVNRFREPTRGLPRVAQFASTLKPLTGYGTPFLVLPEPLPAGYYLAEVSAGDLVRQVHFQVTDLAAYLSITATNSLIWINDSSTGGPVSGAEVTLPKGKATTGADGVATFETPDAEGLYLPVRAGAREAVVALRPGGYSIYSGVVYPSGPVASSPAMDMGRGIMPVMQPSAAPGYWKYLYLDRPLYQPNDTVQLFGVLAPREPGATPVSDVTAVILRRQYRWLGFGDDPPPLARAGLIIADGSFSGSLALPNLEPGYYEVQIRQGDDPVISQWFEVQTYTKPAYRITASSDRRAVFAGEPVTFKAETSFFEGTPVPNLSLNYGIGGFGGGQGRLTTGPSGAASVSFTPVADPSSNRGVPEYANFNLWASLPEAGEISANTGVQVFSRNVVLRPSVDMGDGTATIKAQVNHVTLDKLNSPDAAPAAGGATMPYWGGAPDYIGTPAGGLAVSATLIEQNWTKVEDGEYYDFIAKKVVKQYHYNPDFREVGSFTETTDKDGQISHPVTIDAARQYQVKLSVADTNGRTVLQEWYFSGRQVTPRQPNDSYRSYRLAPTDPQKQVWNVGEEVALQLLENDAALSDRPGGFLFYQARRGLQSYTIQNQATYRFPFKASDVPNTNIKGVYFDGRQYREAPEFPVHFDAKQRELKVAVTPDRTGYRPGETVKLAVHVTDRDGRPVRAAVNLSLVDEALFALRNSEADILARLYGEQIESGILRTQQAQAFDVVRNGAASTSGAPTAAPAAPAPAGAGAKQMAADAVSVRRDFRDASYFGTVTTDSSGQGNISFKLPDNLTTWRLTYQAFAPGQTEAATGTAPVAVKIPFFVDAVMSDTYLAGDAPVIAVRSFGTDLAEGQSVDYSVTVTGPAGQGQTVTKATGKAFAPVSVPVPGPGRGSWSSPRMAAGLPEGAYTVTVKGEGPGGLTDTLEKRFAVVDSYLTGQKASYQVLEDGTSVQGPGSGLVTLLFTDHQRGRWLQLLNQLRYSGGERLEQKLARSVAADLLKTYFGDGGNPDGPSTKADPTGPAGPEPEEWNPQEFQAPDGSIAILPYADGDLTLSALAADLAADRFDREALAEYFYQIVDDPKTDRERGITALYGLAALGEPVLQQVRSMVAAVPGVGPDDAPSGSADARTASLTPSDQLRLAMAEAALGDLEGARPLYRLLMGRYGETLGANARFNLGRDQDEIISNTALAAVLAARLGEPEAPALLGYLVENPGKEVLLSLEELIAARAALPLLPTAPAAFTYVDGGQTKTQTIKAGETIRWTVNAAQLAALQLKPKQGQVGVSASYPAPLTAAELRQEPGYAVTRTYTVEGKGAVTASAFEPGDLVRVTLAYQIPETAPGGGFAVTDFLPSGLRLVQRPYQRGIPATERGPAWPMAVSGQRITFWAWQKGDPTFYYARVVSPGDYTAEQPILQHQQSGALFAHGSRAQVSIHP